MVPAARGPGSRLKRFSDSMFELGAVVNKCLQGKLQVKEKNRQKDVSKTAPLNQIRID